MDESVRAAITAVHFENEASATQWFEHLCATYQRLAEAGQPEWTELSSALTDGADSTVVEQFIAYLTAYDMAPVETIGRMVELSTELPMLHQQLTTATDHSGQEPYDES